MMDDLRPTRYLTVAGVLLPDGRLILHPGFVTEDPAGSQDAPDSPLVGELVDESGRVLLRSGIPVAPFLVERAGLEPDDVVEGPGLREQAVAGKLPYPEATKVIRFLLRGEAIHELRVPDREPQVKLEWDPPRDVSGVQKVSWRGEHAEDRELSYLVAYSNDGGGTWQPVSLPSPATEMEVNFDQLPGGDGRLQVLATDGAHTTRVDSPSFRVARKPCLATIMEPADGAELPAEEPVLLHGQGYYLEEHRPELEELAWSSSTDGALGKGAVLMVSLSPGTHTITLQAGGGRRAGQASVVVELGARG